MRKILKNILIKVLAVGCTIATLIKYRGDTQAILKSLDQEDIKARRRDVLQKYGFNWQPKRRV